MPNRLIAIGDIHGCSLALTVLLEAVQPTALDTIVTLGDYIDRGPDSKGVVDQLLELQRLCRLIPILGNHEEMILAAREDSTAMRYWVMSGGQATLQSYGLGARLELYPVSHWRFFESCKQYYETRQHVFTHANYHPTTPMDRQPGTALRWDPLIPEMMKPHQSGKTVYVGHTHQASGEILDLGFVKCLDTYCYGGGWLTALEIYSGSIWQANKQGQLRVLDGGQPT